MSVFFVNNYTPTRVVFGFGRLSELETIELPGTKPLITVTEDGLMEKLGIQQRVTEMFEKRGISPVFYNKVQPNPTAKGVMEARDLARAEGCDFFIGLGGGSSIDTAKTAAAMMKNDGYIWDYGYAGSGGKKTFTGAAPIMTISTTSGTGTEVDNCAVITNEETGEKLDFVSSYIFPTLSIIDPELMITLPHSLTLYQGFDALFHLSECYVVNRHINRLQDIYCEDGIRLVAKYLPVVCNDGSNVEARVNMAYAADILAGYAMSLNGCTSHHIAAQTMGGLFPNVAHGATLILMAEQYYTRVYKYFPDLFDEMGEFMGVSRDPNKPGYGFVQGLINLLDATGMRELSMSSFGIKKEDLHQISDMTVNNTGIDDVDIYSEKLTVQDFDEILEKSYK